MGDRCTITLLSINDSLIHDNDIPNPVISMYLVLENQRDFDTATDVTSYIRKQPMR